MKNEMIHLGGIWYRVREFNYVERTVSLTLPHGKVLYHLPLDAYDRYQLNGTTNYLPITKGEKITK